MGSYSKSKGRASYTSFFGLPKEVMAHPNYIRLTPAAVKLLNDIGYQYNGNNNGDLCTAFSVMQARGWRSKDTLWRAIDCALHYGMILKTRQGGRHQATLYALTWKPIDECRGKLEVAETRVAPGTWKENRPDWKPKSSKAKNKAVVRKQGQCGTESVLINPNTGEKWRVLSQKPYQSRNIPSVFVPDSVPLYKLPRDSAWRAA
jgi:hypothetical protein